MTENQSSQFIYCEKCQGTGKGKLGLPCSNCQGMAIGTFYEKSFLYWGMPMGKATIKLRHLKKTVNLIVNIVSVLIGLIGFFSLAYWLWNASEIFLRTGRVDSMFFWKYKSIYVLIFWISVIFDMFVVYRLSDEQVNQSRIRQLESNRKDVSMPNTWNELRRYKHKIDVSSGYSALAIRALESAYMMAQRNNHKEVTVMHVFLSLLENRRVSAMFVRLDADGRKLLELIGKQFANQGNSEAKITSIELSNQLKEVLIEAYIHAHALGQKMLTPINLILPAIRKDENLREILYDLEIDDNKIINVVEWFRINEKLIEDYRTYKKMARYKPGGAMDRAYTAVATPILNHYSRDITRLAKWGRLGVCVARDKELNSVFEAFESGQKGVLLTGVVGVGKKTIVNGIARLMVEEKVPAFLCDKRLIELDIARLVSGATPAQAEERLMVIIDEILRAGNIVLFINDIENIVGITAGAEQSLELSEVLANALEQYNIFCIATATTENYTKYIEGKAIAYVMSRIQIEEPQDNQAIQIVESKIGIFENKYKVYFSYDSIEFAVELANKTIHDSYLPEKAFKVLESTAVRVSKRCQTDKNRCVCTKEDIAETISAITKIPVTKISETEGQKLLNLEEEIHERMIDQEAAVKMVSDSLRRARTNLREGVRPIASFLFLGPTGVGKTELAKTVSEVYFGDENLMIRLDMSEYQQPDSVNKMIGDAQTLGYLTEAVRKQPYALILLDELEKAHPDILNLFLQVMDDGRLTDGQGRTIDFTNSIIIATSNAGANYIQEKISENVNTDINEIKEVIINEYLNKVMRPELINRFDGVIVFKPLSRADVQAITKLMLGKIRKMLEAKGIGLKAADAGVEVLAQLGYDPKFGARPLRRLLQDRIENRIAEKILSGELSRRDMIIINEKGEVEVEKGREL